jgi:hypothetical protein
VGIRKEEEEVMRKWRTLVAILVVGAIVGGGWAYAQRKTGAVRPLSGADIAEIEQLHARYSQGWDFRDVELYLSAYTDDAVFTTGAGEAYFGKKAIKDYLTAGFARGESGEVTHNNAAPLITATPEGAQGRVYWVTMNVMSRPPSLGGVGHYNDTYVKTADGWRIKTRTSVRGWAKRVWPPTATANR